MKFKLDKRQEVLFISHADRGDMPLNCEDLMPASSYCVLICYCSYSVRTRFEHLNDFVKACDLEDFFHGIGQRAQCESRVFTLECLCNNQNWTQSRTIYVGQLFKIQDYKIARGNNFIVQVIVELSRVHAMNLTGCTYYQDPFDMVGLQPNLIVLNDHSSLAPIYLSIALQSRWKTSRLTAFSRCRRSRSSV